MEQSTSKQVSGDPLHRVKGQLNKNTTTLSRKIVEKNNVIKTKEKQLLKVQTERQTLMNQLEYLKQTNVVSSYQLPLPANIVKNNRQPLRTNPIKNNRLQNKIVYQ